VERVKSGIAGLDEMLSGGFLPQTANLIEGAPGTGKTTIGMQFIYNGIHLYDEPGLIVSFEEFPQQYYRDAASFDWDFRELEHAGKLKVIMTSPEVSKLDLERVGGMIESAVEEMGACRILVDSISHFEKLTSDPVELRAVQYSFLNSLKRARLTSVLTQENPALLGEPAHSESTVAFLVDCYVLLRYVEIESTIRKALLVLKMRGSDHDKDIRQFEITDKGVVVKTRFEGQEGIMSGHPHRMADSFVEAFVKR
jgi:circadian clock protein KaiC